MRFVSGVKGTRSVSIASLKGALCRVRRASLSLVLASIVAVPAGAADFAKAATLSPSLEARMAPSFQFKNGLSAADKATASANAFSHLHAAKREHLAAAFGQVEKRTTIDPKMVARQLAKAKKASSFGMPVVAFKGKSDDASRRVAAAVAKPMEAPVVLAYAPAAPVEEDTPLAAIASVAPIGEDADGLASLPEAAPVPANRPDYEPKVVQDDEPDQRGERREELAAKPQRDKPDNRDVALAKPEKPQGSGFGEALRGIFGGNGGLRAGNGVAVYDIAAAKVYMPDGSVLEAHSGIGKMADNPKYQHIKMNGPTPAHTYNLKMRERRFHGVEAVRMLPVDGKNKFGRDGFLTHSYLLRGPRTGQSHGCVAFKDYNKFLRAFKQGKVKKMIVVPSGGATVARRGKAGVGA